MASNDDPFGADFSASGFENLGLFTNGNVDDHKYESLLADLRAHDLLGDVSSSQDGVEFTTGLGGTSSSLFFNDAFSAVFMGSFGGTNGEQQAESTSQTDQGKKAPPPPGFTSAPPGLAPSEADLKWARGQEDFSKLEEKFHQKSPWQDGNCVDPQTDGNEAAKESEADDNELVDETQLLSLKALGLDDDDTQGSSNRSAPSPVRAPPGFAATSSNALETPDEHQQSSNTQAHAHTHAPPPGMTPPTYPMHAQPPLPGMLPHPPMGAMPPRGPPFPPPPPPSMPHAMHGYGPPRPPHMMMGRPPPAGSPHGPPSGPPHGPPRGPWHAPAMPMSRPGFQMMQPRDVNFVIQQQTKQLRLSDPFSDDYYFHNHMQKLSRAAGVRPGQPLPSWKLEHVQLVDPRDQQRLVKSRAWESEYKVLGRNQKSSLYRPKQMLNLTNKTESTQDASEQVTEGAVSAKQDAARASENRAKAIARALVEAEAKAAKVLKASSSHESVFANDLWVQRKQVDRGFECLLSLQDARHLLDARGINVQQFHSMSDADIDPALAELRHRTATLLVELAALLGVVTLPEGGMQCKIEQLHTILELGKGKQLVARALPLLHPFARFVLLPALVQYMLSVDGPFGQTKGSGVEGDDRLCQTLVVVLMYHRPTPPPEVLATCLQCALAGHNVESLRAVLYDRSRAEALQALLQSGGASIANASEDVTQLWNDHQRQFVTLATAIRDTPEP